MYVGLATLVLVGLSKAYWSDHFIMLLVKEGMQV